MQAYSNFLALQLRWEKSLKIYQEHGYQIIDVQRSSMRVSQCPRRKGGLVK